MLLHCTNTLNWRIFRVLQRYLHHVLLWEHIMRYGQVYSGFDFYFTAKKVYKWLWNDLISSLHSLDQVLNQIPGVRLYIAKKEAFISSTSHTSGLVLKTKTTLVLLTLYFVHKLKKNYFPLRETPKNGTFSYVKVELILNRKKSMYPNHFVKTVINNYFHPYNLATTTCKNIKN